MKCKVCGEEKQAIELTSDDICIPCHLALLDEAKGEPSLLYIITDGQEG
jgi:hypothetical protein